MRGRRPSQQMLQKMNKKYLNETYGKVVDCVQCKAGFMDRNIPPVYCHGLIFCSADCCKCVHCQRGFMDMNIVPVVCHAMFFCSVECCNYYLGFW